MHYLHNEVAVPDSGSCASAYSSSNSNNNTNNPDQQLAGEEEMWCNFTGVT